MDPNNGPHPNHLGTLVMLQLARVFAAAILATLTSLPAASGQTSTSAVALERWNGSVSLPGGGTLDFSIALDGSAGTIDVPMQGAKGLKLTEVTSDAKVLKFTLKVPGGEAMFEASVEAGGQSAAGHLHQGGADLPLKLTRAKEGEAAPTLRRPQEPVRPFPYSEREVSYVNAADGTTLAGTLTAPSGEGKFPAVVLITGSGAQDRNESLLGHKPFLVLSDYLTRHGIAVLRVDDRGVGGSTGTVNLSTSADFAGDVIAGVEFLSHQPEIDPDHIGLIGHSEGGIIAPMAAVRTGKVAFIVLMAGTGLPGRDIIRLQSELISTADGDSPENAKNDAALQDQLFELVVSGADEATIKTRIREISEQQLAAHEKSDKAEDREKAKTGRASLDATVDQQARELTSPWFKYFLTLDPRESLRQVKCPVLAINGEKDLQVPPKANLPEIQRSLAAAGNPDVTIRELPGLNHLFQKCVTGSPSEYASIDETINPGALELIAQWIESHAHRHVETPGSK